MKLEYIGAHVTEAPLLRLYDFDEPEAKALLNVFRSLATGELPFVDLESLPFVETIGDCSVRAISSELDREIQHLDGGNSFEWEQSPENWMAVCHLIEPFSFAIRENTYQWLTDSLGIEVLFTPSGRW